MLWVCLHVLMDHICLRFKSFLIIFARLSDLLGLHVDN